MPAHRVSKPRLPHTLGFKLGGIFVLLTMMLFAVFTTVVINLSRVYTDVRKYIEESREARLSERLLWQLNELEVLSRPTLKDRQALLREALLRAREDLEAIYSPRSAHDPSRPEHQAKEDRMDAELRASLTDLEVSLSRGSAAETERILGHIRDQAFGLEAETQQEAAHATSDLEQRIARLVGVMTGSALSSASILILLFWLVRRHLLRPVRLLHQGTELFTQGSLDHRIDLDSRDEIGELARAFNRMAERLAHHQRELEELVQERTRDFLQAAKLADLGTFAAGMAHEVNTPLASIASCAEGLERRILSGQAEPERTLEYLRTIIREAYRAHDITARLLSFARQDSGPIRPLRLEDCAGEAVEMIRHSAERRGLRIETEIEDGLPAIEANGPEIEQMIVNLLKNAADASSEGGAILLSCRRAGAGEVSLEVRDQGTGIPPEQLPRIFDPFFTTKEPGKGTGLGLSLAYRIVERHGGRIEARNAPGGGALFRVVLPALPDLPAVRGDQQVAG